MSKFFLFFLLIAFCFACQPEMPEIEENKSITITGNIQNAGNVALRVSGMIELVKDSTDTDGNFNIHFEHPHPEYFTLRMPGQSLLLFLYPGDSIHVNADKENFSETFLASGDRAKEANYLFEKMQIETRFKLGNFRELYALESSAYLARTDSAKTALTQHLEEFKSAHDADPMFVKYESAYADYKFTELHGQYDMYYRWLKSIPKEDSIDFEAAFWKKELSDLPNDDPAMLAMPAYRSVLIKQAGELISEIMEQDTMYDTIPNGWMHASVEAASRLFLNPEVNEWYLFQDIQQYINYAGPGVVDEFYNAFMETATNDFYKSNLKQTVERWDHIKPGSDVPDFTFTDIDSNSVSLSDLRGKLVYVDVWATWCGPCIAEHPDWDKLFEEYGEGEIAFLTVSIDNTRSPWEKMVAEKDMKGIHWFADGNWNSELAKHFLIQGIPRFILIDQQGKVIRPSAERPSGKIREDIDKHLSAL
jgi:thiol-disulfide isomerase/thioredoxin